MHETTGPLSDADHTHVYGDWRPIDGMWFLRRRYCVINGCNSIEYGTFDNSGGFLQVITLSRVEEYMEEVQEAYDKERRIKMQVENEAQSKMIDAHATLQRELLHAKLRLTGGR